MNIRKALEEISMPQVAAVLTSFVYVTGYLISSLYVRSRGINEMSIVSAKYIETGLVFTIITALFVAIPYVIAVMALDSRKKHGYPMALLWLVYPLITTNYLFVLAFFALFVTRYEWLLTFDLAGVQTGIKQCFSVYLVALFVLQVLFLIMKYAVFTSERPFVRMEKGDDQPILKSRFRRWFANAVMALSVILTVAFDYVLYFKLDWFPQFMSRAAFYLFCILLIAVVGGMIRRLARIYAESERRLRFWVVAGVALLAGYYFALSSYEFGIYINIPMSRGGRYPITMTTLYFAPDSLQAKQGQSNLTAYVVEETEGYYYVVGTDVENWFQGHPPVTGIRKSDVAYTYYEHLKSGEPRINHLKQRKVP